MAVAPDANSELELDQANWVGVVAQEYLESYIGQGGAAVKVVIAEASTRTSVTAALRQLSESEHFVFAGLGPVDGKLHLVDKLFHALARQVDWISLTQQFIHKALLAEGFQPPADGDLSYESIAKANDLDEKIVKQHFRRYLGKNIMKRRDLTRDFRLAMMALCDDCLDADSASGHLADSVLEWLEGSLPRITALKEVYIYSKINRHNARGMLASTSAWARQVGDKGLVIAVDLSGYPDPGAVPEGVAYRPTRSAALDAYEMVRQFIDGTDEMQGVFMMVLVGQAFATDETRGLRAYDALRLRLTDDVRDKHRGNPLAPMVRLV